MKVKVPQEIKLLTHTYRVRFDAKALASAQTGGLIRHLYKEILLDNVAYPLSELNQIFLHELIHVMERHLNITIDDADVDRMAEGFAELLFNGFGIELDWSDIKED
ncbi:hypothetical protein LCGC14_2570940 [marine sediment metagenome]|uniref:Uncharacterized protein n=1 Tax=marine sediment metagenome TaxID=412755 RepID=A0A0F9B560_9ZZZZ